MFKLGSEFIFFLGFFGMMMIALSVVIALALGMPVDAIVDILFNAFLGG